MKDWNELLQLSEADNAALSWKVQELKDDLQALRAELNRWETCEYVTESLCNSGTFTPALCDTCKENKTKEGTK